MNPGHSWQDVAISPAHPDCESSHPVDARGAECLYRFDDETVLSPILNLDRADGLIELIFSFERQSIPFIALGISGSIRRVKPFAVSSSTVGIGSASRWDGSRCLIIWP